MVSTIQTIAMLFAAVGIPAATIKYVAEYKDDRNKTNSIVSSGVITSLLLGIVFSVFFYFSSGVFEEIFKMPGLSGLLKILSPIFPFALVGGVLLGFLNGLREIKKYGTATIIQSVLMLVVSVLLIFLGFGVAGVVIGVVLASMGWCLYLLLITKDYFDITFEGYSSNTKKMLVFGSQIFAGNAINLINYQADIIMIGYFLTATDVGYYAVAVGLSKFFWVIPQAVQTITYPATSEYWGKNNHSALQSMIDKSMRYTTCALFPIGLGVVFFANEIITLIYGDVFVYSVLPLQILVVGTVIYGIAGKAIGGSTSAIGRPDINLKVIFISAFVNIILNLLLIPRFGIIGAAIATAVSWCIVSVLFTIWCIKLFSLKIDIKWYRSVSVSVFLSMVFFYVGQLFVEKYIIGFFILFSLTILIYYLFLNNEDRKFIISLIKIKTL